MKKNGYFLCMFVLFCSVTNTIDTATTKPRQPLVRNLIILINPAVKNIEDPVFIEFVLAMCSQVAPIIVHKNMLPVYTKMIDDTGKISSEGAKGLSRLLAFEKFDFFEQKESDLFLVVPLGYKNKLAKEFPDFSEDDRLGFEVANSALFTKMTAEQIAHTSLTPLKSTIFADDILALFQRDNFESPNGVWNIYLAGHGELAYIKGEVVKLFAHKKMSEMINLEDIPYTAALRVDDLRQLIGYLQQFNTNFLFYKSCYAGGYNLLMPFVTNLFVEKLVSEEEAKKIWPTLEKEKRAPRISHIKSGVLVKGELKDEESEAVSFNPNFTIAVGSSFDAPVATFKPNLVVQCGLKGGIPEGKINFGAFFDLLTEYTQNELKILGVAPKPIKFSGDELRKILSKVTERVESQKDPLGLRSMPQVRFPSIGVFVPFPLDPQKVFVLSNILIKGAQLEKKPIIIPSNPTPEAVIMPGADIPITLKITTEKMPALVSQLPGIGVHIIESIEAEKVPFAEFVRSFAFINVAFQKYFYIKKVVVKNDLQGPLIQKDPLVLSDVLIAVLNSNVRMFFTTENSVYFTAAYLSGEKKKDTRIQSLMLQDSPATTRFPIVPGSDVQMPDYLSLYADKRDTVDNAFEDWNKHAGYGIWGMINILPADRDKTNIWGPLEIMSGEQKAKTELVTKKVQKPTENSIQ